MRTIFDALYTFCNYFTFAEVITFFTMLITAAAAGIAAYNAYLARKASENSNKALEVTEQSLKASQDMVKVLTTPVLQVTITFDSSASDSRTLFIDLINKGPGAARNITIKAETNKKEIKDIAKKISDLPSIDVLSPEEKKEIPSYQYNYRAQRFDVTFNFTFTFTNLLGKEETTHYQLCKSLPTPL